MCGPHSEHCTATSDDTTTRPWLTFRVERVRVVEEVGTAVPGTRYQVVALYFTLDVIDAA